MNFDIDYLRECFDFDFDKGTAKWRRRPRSHFKSNLGYKIFNKRFAGNDAFTDIGNTYKRTTLDGKQVNLHRIIFAVYNGYYPKSIDHINQDKMDNRVCNLIDCTASQNARNHPKKSNNKSGFTGVCWHKASSKWTAQISYNKKKIYLGVFDNMIDAVAARIRANKEYNYSEYHGA